MSRAFLGWVDENKVKRSPLVVPRYNPAEGRERLAATWNRGASVSPHVLIVGASGGGTSSLVRLATLDLVREKRRARERLDLTIIDGTGAGEYTFLRSVPGVEIINSNDDAHPGSIKVAAEALRLAVEKVISRNAALEKAQDEAERARITPTYELPTEHILVIDKWMAMMWDFAQILGANVQRQAISQAIQIGRLGRKVSVHLVIATQWPDATSDDAGLPGELRAQLGCRIAAVGPLGMLPIESQLCFGDADTAHAAPSVLGGCVMRVGNTKVPFVAPKMVNPTTVDRSVTDEERAAVWSMLPKIL
jgi:DNA segregation ATPase FtsK/SpoIIIE-like protein